MSFMVAASRSRSTRSSSSSSCVCSFRPPRRATGDSLPERGSGMAGPFSVLGEGVPPDPPKPANDPQLSESPRRACVSARSRCRGLASITPKPNTRGKLLAHPLFRSRLCLLLDGLGRGRLPRIVPARQHAQRSQSRLGVDLNYAFLGIALLQETLGSRPVARLTLSCGPNGDLARGSRVRRDVRQELFRVCTTKSTGELTIRDHNRLFYKTRPND